MPPVEIVFTCSSEELWHQDKETSVTGAQGDVRVAAPANLFAWANVGLPVKRVPTSQPRRDCAKEVLLWQIGDILGVISRGTQRDAAAKWRHLHSLLGGPPNELRRFSSWVPLEQIGSFVLSREHLLLGAACAIPRDVCVLLRSDLFGESVTPTMLIPGV